MKVRSSTQDALSLMAVAGTIIAFEKYLKDPTDSRHACLQATLRSLKERFTEAPSTTQAVLIEYLTAFKTAL